MREKRKESMKIEAKKDKENKKNFVFDNVGVGEYT